MDVQRRLAGTKSIQGALRVLALLQLTAHRFPPQATVTDGDTFDFIVVGAGTAGCVVANRLTEDPNVRVLLVEAGGDPPLESVIPSTWGYLLNSPMDWNYTTINDGYSTQCHINKKINAHTGKMLGGSSSLNAMIFSRGESQDFDRWAKITKDESWSYQNILPYFKKSERLEDDEIMHSNTRSFHGTNGYVRVTKQTHKNLIPYLKAYEETGLKYVLDANGNETLGYGELLFNRADDVRQGSAQGYLSTITNRTNLFVLKHALCTKIIFDKNKNARSVEIIDENTTNLKLFAKKEVIISAGAIKSPQLLMLSGIGPKKHLQSIKIPVVSDLQVGQNLQDHISAFLLIIMDEVNNSTKSSEPQGIHIVKSFKSMDKNLSRDYNSMISVFPTTVLIDICSNVYGFDDEICQQMYESSKGKKVALVFVGRSSLESRGEVLLQSKNPKVSPLIDLKAYSNPVDLNDTIRYVKDFLTLLNASHFKNAKLFQPDCVKDMKVGSDEYWRKYILCLTYSGFHYAGTCAMGSVLDSRLRVLGVSKLRVVDGSAMPILVKANPTANIMMMGEKAADMIKEDNGLKL